MISLGIAAFAALLAAGCSSESTAPKPQEPIQVHLLAIGTAYIKTAQKLGRPPKNVADIRPALQEAGDPDQLLRSPIDGEEFVIIWGINPFDVPPSDKGLPVLVYEKKGKDGKRYVLQLPTLVVAKTDEELKKAYFPGDHKFSP